MTRENIVRRLPARFCALPFSVFILVLTYCSYRAKELLVCWLLFCSFFALLALMFLGVVLVFFAGQHLVQRVRAANSLIPMLAARLAELSQEPVSGPRFLVTAALKLAVGPCPVGNVPDADPCTLAGIASSVEEDVSK